MFALLTNFLRLPVSYHGEQTDIAVYRALVAKGTDCGPQVIKLREFLQSKVHSLKQEAGPNYYHS